MSRIVNAKMTHAIIKDKDDLRNFIDFDLDISGANGDEFTNDEALKKGFETTADWIFSRAMSKGKGFKKQIEIACKMIVDTDNLYVNPVIEELNDGSFFVGIIVMEEN